MGSLTALWTRVYAVLGRLSMYRLVVFSLAALAAVALLLSAFDLVGPAPLELIATTAVLAASCAITDVIAHRVLRRSWRWESSLITALILLFVLRPTLDVLALVGIAVGGVVASVSKYVLAWQGRHIFNPAAVGAAAVTVIGVWLPGFGTSAWWVGTPFLAGPVLLIGLAVLARTEKVRVVALFVAIAVVVGFVHAIVQYQDLGVPVDAGQVFWSVLWSSPFLFLGAFMLSEPLTLPPRRWQQYTVAAVVGVLAGWPIALGAATGALTLGQERALLIGNLVAFAFTVRTAVRLTLVERVALTPSVRELVFRAERRFRFQAGQYLELEVPHPHPDARGTRREFSIVSAPEELPTVRIALREGSQSSYKQALARVEPGEELSVTGVWGDFVLPRSPEAPVLMVAAGIGVTPFVSQLRHLKAQSVPRDVVFVYVASDADELAFRADIEDAGIPVVVFTRTEPVDLPDHWRWARGARVNAEGLLQAVPDIARRHAYVSGPPGLIAELTPALERARSITTDAFSGY